MVSLMVLLHEFMRMCVSIYVCISVARVKERYEEVTCEKGHVQKKGQCYKAIKYNFSYNEQSYHFCSSHLLFFSMPSLSAAAGAAFPISYA